MAINIKSYKKYIATPKGMLARNKSQKAYRVRIREAVLTILGGECVECGFDDKRALHVDHINGGGNQERKELKSVTKYYKKIISSVTEEKEEYQLLCANCNMIKKINNKEHR